MLLIYTQTRGTYIGILMGIFVGIIILFIKRKNLTQKSHRKIISSLFVLMLIGVISLVSVITISKNSSFVKDNIFLNRISTINLNIANPFLIYHSIKTENYKEMLTTFGDGTLVSRGLNISIAMNGLKESVKTFIFG
ncbi:MAG: O-antigen ligase family protein [Candidatus Pacebacteria bacterium]|nr:O-antigen ligase family protein [Candidatus Paceibacterota bacterium]